MARFRLPADWGGKEVDGIPAETDAGPVVSVVISHCRVDFPAGVLTAIGDPEPSDNWAVIMRPLVLEGPLVFFNHVKRHKVADHWWSYEHREWMTWAQVAGFGQTMALTRRTFETDVCSVCGLVKPLRTDGMVRTHGGRSPRECKGSGQLPAGTEVTSDAS